MTVFTEGRHPAEFVLSEGDKNFSRDNIVIAASQTIVPGSVLGKRAVAAGVVATAAADAGNTAGSGALTLASPAVSSKVKDGVYNVICTEPATNGGTFEVTDPSGKSIGKATVGVAFNKEIKFTIADATDFVAGDRFTVTVAADADDFEYGAHDPAASDGLEVAAALALYPATTGVGESAKISAITRHSEVNGKTLTWKSGIAAADLADGIQALASRGIIVR
ncbi:head decoration protein [Mesorhizobium sp. M1403]|uniref:head decoration protein n=1 Tax=Mesorhizobium sp. M1403 TaxID=2957097 RepID=UPI003337B9F7